MVAALMGSAEAPPPNVTVAQRDALGTAVSITRRRPRLRWADASGPRAVALDGRAVLGTAPGVDVPVSDPAVSRLHMELETRDDGVWVRDLGSRNGTFIEGVMVQSARAAVGARIVAGSTTFPVGHDATPAPVDLWPNERFGPLLGRSVAMRELFARLARVAASDALRCPYSLSSAPLARPAACSALS